MATPRFAFPSFVSPPKSTAFLPLLEAERPRAPRAATPRPFGFIPSRHRAAMRWRGWLGGFLPRLFPHSLSPLALFLIRRHPLRPLVPSLEPLTLFRPNRLPSRALVDHVSGGAQGWWWVSLWSSPVGLGFFLSCSPPQVPRRLLSASSPKPLLTLCNVPLRSSLLVSRIAIRVSSYASKYLPSHT